MSKLLANFPDGFIPRKSQEDIILHIEKALPKKKFIIVQAPTGAGKGHISATIANSSRYPDPVFVQLADSHRLYSKKFGNGYENEDVLQNLPKFGCAVLTVSKTLQNQYDHMFPGSNILKGKQNYICAVDEDFECDLAPCMITPSLLEKCKQLERCPFLNARRDALKSRFAVFNYSSFLTLPQTLQRREYIVCDEASELEDELVKHYSCTIDYKRIKLSELGIKKLLTNDSGVAYRWLSDLVDAVKAKQESLQEVFAKNKKNKRQLISAITALRLYRNMYEKLVLILQNWYSTEFIIEPEADKVKFTPLFVNILAQNFFKHADHVILMSATIIDHAMFAKSLGITEYEYIEVDSEFTPSQSPIYCLDKFKLNYKNLDKILPKLVEIAKRVCDKYPDDKGIIHTHTFKITKALQDHIKNDKRFLLREPGITNEYLLHTHRLSTKGTVIISPSLGFGTDLSDEFGRFSVIMKTPYLPLGDKRIKTIADRNPRWYQMKALITLVQMCGRTTRSVTDFSDTYILDGTAVDLIKRNIDKLPRFFRDRLQ